MLLLFPKVMEMGFTPGPTNLNAMCPFHYAGNSSNWWVACVYVYVCENMGVRSKYAILDNSIRQPVTVLAYHFLGTVLEEGSVSTLHETASAHIKYQEHKPIKKQVFKI